MTKVIIYGYGNLGRSVHTALGRFPDLSLAGICSRRADQMHTSDSVPFWTPAQLESIAPAADVVINCGGSAADLPRTTPALAAHRCVVDAFDTHKDIPRHLAATDAVAKAAGTLCLLCCGWDPGLFSIARVLGAACMPDSQPATFWGPGVSQGHSDALRSLPDVLDARQYTIPDKNAIAAARSGQPFADAVHRRVCYVVPRAGTDINKLTNAIKTMPHYFAGSQVDIHYTTKEKLATEHSRLPHGGRVICTEQCNGGAQSAELQLTLASNPDFTAGVLLAAARATVRLHSAGQTGAITMADVPPALYTAEQAQKYL